MTALSCVNRTTNNFSNSSIFSEPAVIVGNSIRLATEVESGDAVCTENLIRVDDVLESPKLAE
jgi:hypothetical protein